MKINIIKPFSLFAAAIFIQFFSFSIVTAQTEQVKGKTVYKVNKKWEIPVTLALFATNAIGLDHVGKRAGLDSLEIVKLDPNDLKPFDRWATQQDPDFTGQAQRLSDLFLNISVALPVFLALDKSIRKDWFDLLVLYGETHAINGNLYVLAASLADRPRPLVYNTEIPFPDRMEAGTLNSFFSGHVSTAAASSFFVAKVYSDYHPEMGRNKYALFGAALVPPLLVGFYRYKAMKHFPSDIFTGLLVGSLSGILVPHLHKKKKNKGGFAFMPFTGDITGCTFTYRLK